jgi:hypothetical protein
MNPPCKPATLSLLGAHVLSALMAAMPAYAHHSFAMFDQKQCLSVAGTVKKLQWEYPHTWLWVVAEAADHSQVVWGFEGGDPATLALHGWNGDVLKKGDKITVFFNPLLDGRKGGSLRHVVLPTGKTLNAQAYDKDDTFFIACKPPSKP